VLAIARLLDKIEMAARRNHFAQSSSRIWQ
jgi:hypothetical protein